MEGTEFIIKIGIGGAIGIMITIIGGLISVAWWSGKKFGVLETGIEGLDKRLTNMESNTAGFTKTGSPISLTEKGEIALNESGLKNYIDKNIENLLSACQKEHNMDNAYDVQTSAFNYFDKFNFEPDFEKKLKEYAFKEGANMDMIRRIAGVYLRDICLTRLKMRIL